MKLRRLILPLGILIVGLTIWTALREVDDRLERQMDRAARPRFPGKTDGDFENIDQTTVEAYLRIGAVPGDWFHADGGLHWGVGNTAGLPGFSFTRFPTAKLPQVAVPFGLHLQDTVVTAADLSRLSHLRTLRLIDLNPSQIRDEHLRVLREIGLLHALNRPGAKHSTVPPR